MIRDFDRPEEEDEFLPDTLDDAQREIIRLREFRNKKEQMIKETQEEAERRLKYAPSFLQIKEGMKRLIDGDGNERGFPTEGIVALYFGMQSCPACRRFEPVLADFYSTNADKGLILVYIPIDNRDSYTIEASNGHSIWRLPHDEPDLAARLRKQLNIVMFPTVLIVDCQQFKVVTRFGREAIDAEKMSGHALIAWKKGYSGYFPEFIERRRTMAINPVGVLIWALGIYLILYFFFGFSAYTMMLDIMKWMFYTFIDPDNKPELHQAVPAAIQS